ncbi:hypothetical protein ANN_15745 [Periplaneta americana]|uniref:DUF4817 domain-containing protein n=1 Tax=Periplaneta americana TaxID=6978 RepID=A0ABQ8SHC0_PERAM|nr:hypothetical protein ANN_15745 [Periplaneta americana]
MSPGSSTESYPAFARIGLRENHGKNLNRVTCPDQDSNPGHLVSRPDALTVIPQRIWCVSLSTMYSLRAFVDSVAENGTTSYTRHVSNLQTTVVSLTGQAAAKVRYSHLTFPTLAFLRCVLEYSVHHVVHYRRYVPFNCRVWRSSIFADVRCAGEALSCLCTPCYKIRKCLISLLLNATKFRQSLMSLGRVFHKRESEIVYDDEYDDVLCVVNYQPFSTQNRGHVCSQSRLTLIVSSTELVNIVRSRNMFAFFSDERPFNIESYFRTEYADNVYVYGLCDGSSLHAVAEYERRFPNRRVPYRRVFTVYGVG